MTMQFSNFSPKIPKQGIFGPKSRNFHFFWENLELDKIDFGDIKYDYIIIKFQSKNTQIRYFCPKFKDFQFCTKLCNKTNSKKLISNMILFFFQIPAQKYPNKAFWSQIQAFLFFHKILQLDKFEGADLKCDNSFFKIPVQQNRVKDFKYDNSIFKLQPKNMQIRHFCFQI